MRVATTRDRIIIGLLNLAVFLGFIYWSGTWTYPGIDGVPERAPQAPLKTYLYLGTIGGLATLSAIIWPDRLRPTGSWWMVVVLATYLLMAWMLIQPAYLLAFSLLMAGLAVILRLREQ